MSKRILVTAAMAVICCGVPAGSALAKGPAPADTAKEAAAKEAAAKEAAAEAAAREAAAFEAAAREAAAREAAKKVNNFDPFNLTQGLSQVTLQKVVAIQLENRSDPRRSPNKPPESPADHDHGRGNDDKDHGRHDDHDNGYHKGQNKQ